MNDSKKSIEQLNAELEKLRKEKDEFKTERDVIIKLAEDILTRVLGGHLLICAKCKRIQSKEGKWEEIEEYIQKHTEAKFNYIYCPDCKKGTSEKNNN